MKYIKYCLMISVIFGVGMASAENPPPNTSALFSPDPDVLALLNPTEAQMYRQGTAYQACMAHCQAKYNDYTTNLNEILQHKKNIQNCIDTICRPQLLKVVGG